MSSSAATGVADVRTVPAPTAADVEIARWWHGLGDPELDSLVERALQANPSLEIALTRLQEARTFEVVLTGYALPRLEASSGGGRGTGSDLSRGRAALPLRSADHALSASSKITQVSGFDAVWDIDLFGKFRREIEAARYDAQAAAAARDAVQIAVIADVVRAYVDLRGLQMQLAVLQQNLRAAKDLLDLVQARFDHGITNELDLTLAQRQFSTVQAGVAPLSAQVDAAAYTIAVLLGRFPEDIRQELAQPGMVPQMPARITPGQPLDLIRRRPDIREAEWELAGATARIGVATANLFPQLQLSAALGRESQGFGYTPASGARIWAVGYGAAFPLLDFGTLDALVDVADLQAHELLVNYKHTVQAAVQDVDTAMVSFLAQQDRLASLGDAVAASQRAMTLATERYDRGLTDFLNVVDAQRQEYDLEGQYAFALMTLGEQYVGLYRALGGGWEQFSGPPPIRTPQPAIVAMFRRLLNPSGADQ
jgi:NodT family efflux transporter outer membrane factor (OMF) lipoprotein